MIDLRRIRAGGAIPTLGLLAAVCVTATFPAGATSLVRMDLTQLVNAADRVVLARAVDRSVYWSERRIYTDTEFEVLEDAKGQGPGRVTVSLLGGRIDPLVMTVAGTPVFDLGDEVILFIEPLSDGKTTLSGFSQGVMKVRRVPGSEERVASGSVPLPRSLVSPESSRVSPERGIAARAEAGDGASARNAVPVMRLLEEIRRLAQASAAPARPEGPRPLEAMVEDGGRR